MMNNYTLHSLDDHEKNCFYNLKIEVSGLEQLRIFYFCYNYLNQKAKTSHVNSLSACSHPISKINVSIMMLIYV